MIRKGEPPPGDDPAQWSRRQIITVGSLSLTSVGAGCLNSSDMDDSRDFDHDTTDDGEGTSDGPSSWERNCAHSIHELTNERRLEHGSPTVEFHDGLAETAWSYSKDMAERGFFDHKDPDGRMPWDRVADDGIACLGVGENLAWNLESDRTEEEMAAVFLEQWMESEKGHRENLLNDDWEVLGVGVYVGDDYRVHATQKFGARCTGG